MKLYAYLVLAASALCFLLLIAGLFWPWVVMWWAPRQNRLMVFRFYGLASAFLYIAHRLIQWLGV